MTKKSGIELALAMYEDSPTKLAKAINVEMVIGDPVLRQHVEHWLKAKKVSAVHAPNVERVTSIPCEILCPDVDWSVVRGTKDSRIGVDDGPSIEEPEVKAA